MLMGPIMRTTISIEDSLIVKLKTQALQNGCSFKDMVNETLRAGIAVREETLNVMKPFKVKSKALKLKFGSYDNSSELLEQAEGEHYK